MSGDWIKMRDNLWDDPRVAKIVDMTDSSEAAVIGSLYWLWSTADQHTEDGFLPGITLRAIDRKTGLKGFSAATCSIGWLEEKPDGVLILEFEKHNGESAKKRAQTARRVAKHYAKTNAESVSAFAAKNGVSNHEPGCNPDLQDEFGKSSEKYAPNVLGSPKNIGNSAETIKNNAVLTQEQEIANATLTQDALPREREEKNINTPQTPAGKPADVVPPGFAAFWATWPSSDRKQAKGKCLEVWKKAHAERDAALVLSHVEHLASSQAWTKESGQFIPAPLSYLRNKSWEGFADGAEAKQAVNPAFAGGI